MEDVYAYLYAISGTQKWEQDSVVPTYSLPVCIYELLNASYSSSDRITVQTVWPQYIVE
jgi:hypothetical protein